MFSQPWKIYQITKETAQNIFLTKTEINHLRGSRLGDLLHSSANNWLNFAEREVAIMYDPLVISAALREGYVGFGGKDNRFISNCINPIFKDKLLEVLK